jgi:uncharacterized protein YdaU (DUF1376 family)
MALTLEERGAYQTLLDMMYDRGGPLIDNERLLAGYMNCSIRKWRQLREQLLEKGKICITKDGHISNSRARKEIENASKTHRKLIESGAKGGRTRAENEKKPNENNGSGQASLKPASSDTQAIRASLPEARSHSVDKSTGGTAADPVKELFDLGVEILTSSGCSEKEARSLIGKWRKAKGDGETMAALLECRSRSVSEPVEWITKRFEGCEYVSATGYRYRGDHAAVMREAEKRADWGTYWAAKGNIEAGRKAGNG